MKAQRDIIKQALLRGERLTRIEAQNDYGVARLAARINEITDVDIERGWRTVPTRLGVDTRIREYWLKREAVAA